MSFDSILNAIIPWIVAILGIYLLYRPLAPALSGLFDWIKRIFRGKVDDLEEQSFFSYPANLEFE